MIVNPDAGLGGRLGLKGSDGLAQKARNAGAEDRAGPRAMKALSLLGRPFERSRSTVANVQGQNGNRVARSIPQN